MEVSKEVKKVILKQELQMYYNSIYQLTIKAKVAKDIEDEKAAESWKAELEKLHKYVDKYETLLKELEEIEPTIK